MCGFPVNMLDIYSFRGELALLQFQGISDCGVEDHRDTIIEDSFLEI